MERVNSIYLDTNLYIYFFENVAPWSASVERFLTNRDHSQPIIASTLLITELLVAPIKQGKTELAKIYEKLDHYIPSLTILPFTREIAKKAADLRATHTISTPDAIHLATALQSQSTTFYTADSHLPNLIEIQIHQI